MTEEEIQKRLAEDPIVQLMRRRSASRSGMPFVIVGAVFVLALLSAFGVGDGSATVAIIGGGALICLAAWWDQRVTETNLIKAEIEARRRLTGS